MDGCDLLQVDSEMMMHEFAEPCKGQFTNIDFVRVNEAVLELVRNKAACFDLGDMIDA